MFVKKSPEFFKRRYNHALYELLVNLEIAYNNYHDWRDAEKEGENGYRLWCWKRTYEKSFKRCCGLMEEFHQASLDRDLPPICRGDENRKVVLDFLKNNRKRYFFLRELDANLFITYRDIEIRWEMEGNKARK